MEVTVKGVKRKVTMEQERVGKKRKRKTKVKDMVKERVVVVETVERK